MLFWSRGPPPSGPRTSYQFLKRKIYSKSKKNGTFLQSKSREESKNSIFRRYGQSLQAQIDDLCLIGAPPNRRFPLQLSPAAKWERLYVGFECEKHCLMPPTFSKYTGKLPETVWDTVEDMVRLEQCFGNHHFPLITPPGPSTLDGSTLITNNCPRSTLSLTLAA